MHKAPSRSKAPAIGILVPGEPYKQGGILPVIIRKNYLQDLFLFMGQHEVFSPGSHWNVFDEREDTGTGIKPEDLPKIFEPYYSRKTMGHSGSGLGLSLVRAFGHPAAVFEAGGAKASPPGSPACSSRRADASGNEVRSRSRVVPVPRWSRPEM